MKAKHWYDYLWVYAIIYFALGFFKRTGGYCPCRRERTEATKCMCQEFKDQIADPDYEGYCHCMLYYKSLKD